MNTETQNARIDTRGFIRAIRAGLDAAGCQDVAISRAWVDLDTPGEELLIHVPVGPELTVALRPDARLSEANDAGDHAREVDSFVKALINLSRGEKALIRYAAGVRRSAREAVETARADGLDVQLAGVGLKEVHAGHLTSADWKDAVSYVLATVTVRHTSFDLRPSSSAFVIGDAAEAEDELFEVFEEQRERQARLAELEAMDADLVVNAITLDILRAYGVDPATALARAWKTGIAKFELPDGCPDRSLSLASHDGFVTATLLIEDRALWNGECLWFAKDAVVAELGDMVGRSLGDLLPHPAFTARPIVHINRGRGSGREIVHFDLSDKLLFDADTGLLRREDRRLAA